MSQQLSPEDTRASKMLEPFKRGGRNMQVLPGHYFRGIHRTKDPEFEERVRQDGLVRLQMPSGRFRYVPAAEVQPRRNPPDPDNINDLITVERAYQLKYPISYINVLSKALRKAKENITDGVRKPYFEYPDGYWWKQPYSLEDIEGKQPQRARPELVKRYRAEDEPVLDLEEGTTGHVILQPRIGERNPDQVNRWMQTYEFMRTIRDDDDPDARKIDMEYVRIFPLVNSMMRRMIRAWWQTYGAVANDIDEFCGRLRPASSYLGRQWYNVLMTTMSGDYIMTQSLAVTNTEDEPDAEAQFQNWLNGSREYNDNQIFRIVTRAGPWIDYLTNLVSTTLEKVAEGAFIPDGSPPLPPAVVRAMDRNQLTVQRVTKEDTKVSDDDTEELIDADGDEFENFEEEEENEN